MKKSVIKSVRITAEQERKLEILGIDFPDFVEENLEKLFREKFYGEIDEQIKNSKKQIKEFEKLKKELEPEPKTADEINYLKETKEIIKTNPEYLKARIKKYSNDFNKVLLTENEFKKLLKKVKWK